MVNFIVKEQEGLKKYDTCMILQSEQFGSLSNPIKIKILNLLSKKAMFINELSKELNLNEQNVYYHMRELIPLLEVVEEKKIRGTIAKKYKPKSMNFCISLSNKFKNYDDFNKKQTSTNSFFTPFIKDGKLDAKIIIGSPDPHGPYKARARDGHYAIDLAFYLGGLCNLPKEFTTSLDVGINLRNLKSNLIVVGGPVTNLIMDDLNQYMPAKFVEEKQWAIKGKKDTYADDNIGLIVRIPHPYSKNHWILVIAGVRFAGTKAAVIGITRKTRLVLNNFTEQKEFYCLLQGFDLDGDGKIDSVELLESS